MLVALSECKPYSRHDAVCLLDPIAIVLLTVMLNTKQATWASISSQLANAAAESIGLVVKLLVMLCNIYHSIACSTPIFTFRDALLSHA